MGFSTDWSVTVLPASKINNTERYRCCSDMRRKIKWNSHYPLKEFSHIPILKCVIKLVTDLMSHCLGQGGSFKLPTGFLQTDKTRKGSCSSLYNLNSCKRGTWRCQVIPILQCPFCCYIPQKWWHMFLICHLWSGVMLTWFLVALNSA